MQMLKAKLYERELAERKAKIDQMGGEKKRSPGKPDPPSYVFSLILLLKIRAQMLKWAISKLWMGTSMIL